MNETASVAKTAPKKERVWYMWYWTDGKRVRSREYPSLKAFVEKCGEWCDNNPDMYDLCSRIRMVASM